MSACLVRNRHLPLPFTARYSTWMLVSDVAALVVARRSTRSWIFFQMVPHGTVGILTAFQASAMMIHFCYSVCVGSMTMELNQ